MNKRQIPDLPKENDTREYTINSLFAEFKDFIEQNPYRAKYPGNHETVFLAHKIVDLQNRIIELEKKVNNDKENNS